MSDDAVRLGIQDVFGWAGARTNELVTMLECELTRPSVLYRPSVAPDGDQWCALYGPDLMDGVCGFGTTPEAAMRDFDTNWASERTPAARAKEATDDH